MSRVGRCIDNGPMEGFCGILKRKYYYGHTLTSRNELPPHLLDSIEIIKQLHNENLSFYEVFSKYRIPRRTLQDWERIYLGEGEEALLVERRGRACAASGTQKGRKPKLVKQVEEDLIAENQRLQMEIDYLKKLKALL